MTYISAKLSKAVSVLLALATVFLGFGILGQLNIANAAAVTLTIQDEDNTSDSYQEFAAGVQEEVQISWASGAEYVNGDEITITVSGPTSLTMEACDGTTYGATTDLDGDTTTDVGTVTYGTDTVTYPVNAGTTTATTDTTVCLQFPTATTQGSYSLSLTDTQDNFGSALVYVEDDNDVTVTAVVAPTLSFNITEIDDDTLDLASNTNVCDLGSLTTLTAPNNDTTVDTGQGECGYGLAVGTNAAAGFNIAVASDGGLDNVGGYALADIAEGATFAAGSESYGFANIDAAQTGFNSGTGAYDVTVTEEDNTGTSGNNFSADSTAVPTTSETMISHTGPIEFVSGTDVTDITKVIHGATIGTGTPTGNFAQVVTYTVTANF